MVIRPEAGRRQSTRVNLIYLTNECDIVSIVGCLGDAAEGLVTARLANIDRDSDAGSGIPRFEEQEISAPVDFALRRGFALHSSSTPCRRKFIPGWLQF